MIKPFTECLINRCNASRTFPAGTVSGVRRLPALDDCPGLDTSVDCQSRMEECLMHRRSGHAMKKVSFVLFRRSFATLLPPDQTAHPGNVVMRFRRIIRQG
nr:MAG TPA_asm: hypothetical protein [Caudoviricetes sp.]